MSPTVIITRNCPLHENLRAFVDEILIYDYNDEMN